MTDETPIHTTENVRPRCRWIHRWRTVDLVGYVALKRRIRGDA